MSFKERELKNLIEVEDISLAYKESYDLNISDRGIYIVNLELEFSEFNEGNTLLLKLNQDITKKVYYTHKTKDIYRNKRNINQPRIWL